MNFAAIPRGGRRLRARTALTVAAMALLMGTVFAGTAAAATVTCGQVITTNTTLSNDVGPCPGNGIIIAADNVTLDLNGHTVTGNPQARAAQGADAQDAAGVLFRNVSNSTVRNGTITGFDAGVAIVGGSGNAVSNVTARDNINYRILTGVNVAPGPDTPSCDFADGIAVLNSSNNVIQGNQVIHNGPLSGIAFIENSDNNLVSRNVVSDNNIVNQVIAGVPNAGQNTVCGTGDGPMSRGRTVQDIGIRIEGPGADNNRVERNDVTRSALVGISINGFVCHPPLDENGQPRFPPGENNGGNLIFKNTVTNTSSNGRDTVADGIAVLQQGPAGIVCVSFDNTIKLNVSTGNDRDGIFLGGRGARNTAINNRVNDNGRDGLHLEGPSMRNGQTFPGASNSKLLANKGSGNARDDGFDGNLEPPCDNNMWRGSKFQTVNLPCVLGPGKGHSNGKGAKAAKARGHASKTRHHGRR